MQSLMFLDYFVQKLSKKNLWGSVPPPLAKGKVKKREGKVFACFLDVRKSFDSVD